MAGLNEEEKITVLWWQSVGNLQSHGLICSRYWKKNIVENIKKKFRLIKLKFSENILDFATI